MKKTGMAKSDAKKLMNQMTVATTTFGNTAPVIDRREQRKRDQALGLVPFAVKINGDIVTRLGELAAERGLDMNTITAEVLLKGLEK